MDSIPNSENPMHVRDSPKDFADILGSAENSLHLSKGGSLKGRRTPEQRGSEVTLSDATGQWEDDFRPRISDDGHVKHPP